MLAEQTVWKHPNKKFYNYSIVIFSNKNLLLYLESLEKENVMLVFKRPQAKATEIGRGSLRLRSVFFYPTQRRIAPH